MVSSAHPMSILSSILSVLALSSRFDGRLAAGVDTKIEPLSVLALSSRFDGLLLGREIAQRGYLSVLALSSRFDGPIWSMMVSWIVRTFSTRSVESF